MTPDQRRLYSAGNWQMIKTASEARDYAQKLLALQEEWLAEAEAVLSGGSSRSSRSRS